MPAHLTFTLDAVYLRAGVVAQTFTAAGLFRPTKPWDRLAQFGVLLYWPKADGWLRLSGTGRPDPGAAPPVPFHSTLAGLAEVCAAHDTPRDQVTPPRFLEAHHFLAASLPQLNRVSLTVEVDTDDGRFRRAVRERRDPARWELVQRVEVLFFDSRQHQSYVGQNGRVDLVLKPCAPLPRFAGVLAVDLGNTTTTAVSLSEDDPVYRTDATRVALLDAADAPGGGGAPMASVLRLDRITSAGPVPDGTRRFPSAPGDDRPGAVAYEAGWWATAGVGGGELPPGVVYGAKQLLSVKDRPAEPYLTMVVPHARDGGEPQPQTVEVLHRVPGELLFTHAARRFRAAARAWPADLVLTYPTTYSPREVAQLTRAAARGWLRAVGQPQDLDAAADPTGDPELDALAAEVRHWLAAGDGAPCPVAGLALDEATAAAFFHIHRRVFEQPGGLVRFRYLYPDGIHLLLVDFGGGTTDIALVYATAPAEERNVLAVDVLARSGVRAFGGDDITRAACRLVKAKLALLLARARTPASVPSGFPTLPATAPPSPAAALRQVDDFLSRIAQLDPRDELVPTKFDPARPGPDTPDRRAAAHALWVLGEKLKRAIGAGKPVRLKELGAEAVGRDTSYLMAAVLRPLPLQAQAAVAGQLGEVTVAPWEVDALVRGPVEAAVEKCNRLLASRLPDGEVDWVIVSGNGALYPLVTRVVQERLQVAYLADRLTRDPENLKGAVAKGAAMARMVERVPRAVGVRFDRHLSELLPFDVGYHDMRTNETLPLFKEFTPYAVLAAETRTVRLVLRGEAPRSLFILERRFPGDDVYTRFASYRFAQGIQGDLEVSYDRGAGEFVVRDAATGEVGEARDPAESDHQVAALRGDI